MTINWANKSIRVDVGDTSIIDEATQKYVDAVQVAMLRISRVSLLPELYEIFGKDKLLKFLEIFGGTTVVVPSREVLDRALRDTLIYLQIERCRQTFTPTEEIVRALAERYEITADRVRAIHSEMHDYMRKCDVKVKFNDGAATPASPPSTDQAEERRDP